MSFPNMVSQECHEAGTLLELCVKAACRDKSSVKAWRQKRRTLEMLPSELAQLLFYRLLQAHLLSAPLIELFQRSLQEVDLSGVANVDGEWMAYVGGCHHLRVLRVADCKALTNNAVWQLTGLTAIEELDLARCRRISDEAVLHIVSLKGLRKLGLAETNVGTKGLSLLPVLTCVKFLDLGGCPVTDENLLSFQALILLENLDLWGSKVTNMGARCLSSFKSLRFLNLAMTGVTIIPPLSSLVSLNLCNCVVESMFGEEIVRGGSLGELYLAGAEVILRDVLFGLSMRSLRILDLASSRVSDLGSLVCMRDLSILDLSATGLTDALMPKFHQFGKNLKWLDLSNTKVGSEGVGAIAGYVPNMEQLSLSHTLVDDNCLAYLVHFPMLRFVNLSSSKVIGTMMMDSEELADIPVLSCLEQLQYLRRLDLRHTGVSDATFEGLKSLTQVSHLYLHSSSLSDECLQQLSCLPNLVCVGIGGAVVTDGGFLEFKPPHLLQELDLTDCWLLSEAALLKFCAAHPHIMVWHECTVSIMNILKPHTDKKKFNDVVSEGYATSMSRELQSAKVGAQNGTVRTSVKERLKLMKRPDMKSSLSVGMNVAVVDERIKYDNQELLQLRFTELSSLSDSVLRIFEDDALGILRKHREGMRRSRR